MEFFRTSYYVLIGALGIMAILFFALPVRQTRLAGYSISLRLMAVSYVFLALYCTFKWAIPIQLCSEYFLFMSSLQCALLSISHINMLHPQLVNKRFVAWHLFPILVFTVLYGIVRLFSPKVEMMEYVQLRDIVYHPEALIRGIWMIGYVVYIIYFAVLYFREEKAYYIKSENFFSDDDKRTLMLVRVGFCFALMVGLTTIVITFSLVPMFSMVLNYVILILYVAIGICYVRYPLLFTTIEPLLFDCDMIADRDTYRPKTWEALQRQIISERLYTQQGITLCDLANLLGVSRTTLSGMINKEGMNFYSFIRHLRVQEARRILETEPYILFSSLAERVGYTEHSSLAHHFKAEMHCTLNDFRQQIIAQKEQLRDDVVTKQ